MFHQSLKIKSIKPNKAITSCFYAVKPRVVYSAGVMLPSAKKDSVPTTQKVVLFMNFRADVKLGM